MRYVFSSPPESPNNISYDLMQLYITKKKTQSNNGSQRMGPRPAASAGPGSQQIIRFFFVIKAPVPFHLRSIKGCFSSTNHIPLPSSRMQKDARKNIAGASAGCFLRRVTQVYLLVPKRKCVCICLINGPSIFIHKYSGHE